MSILCKPYQISLWKDVWNGEKYVEKRMMIIGSNTMEAQCRALEPKLTRKTNGEVSFSFKMYYQYIDNITGEKVRNPFVDYIVNESKIKLKYNNEWFDLIVKNISEDSTNYTYLYTLQDQNVLELSKNGFNLTLDSTLMNNMGTIEELGAIILADTDWTIDPNSEKIVQTEDESLVPCKVGSSGLYAINIDDSDLGVKGAIAGNQTYIGPGETVYVFYSSCSGDNPYRFQFLYKADGFTSEDKDSERIITTKMCQFYIDDVDYETNGIYSLPPSLMLTYPEGNVAVSLLYRGRRYVYAQENGYHAGMERYLQKYTDGTNEYYGYTKTNYVTPNLIQNFVTNADFSTDAGWRGSKFCKETPTRPSNIDGAKKLNTYLRSYPLEQWKKYISTGSAQQWAINEGHDNSHIAVNDIIKIEGVISNQNDTPISVYAKVTSIEYIDKIDPSIGYRNVAATTVWYSIGANELDMEIKSTSFRIKNGTLIESLTDHLKGAFDEKYTYYPSLRCGRLNNSTDLRKVLVNSGPYDFRKNFEGFVKDEKYVVEMEFYYASLQEDGSYKIEDFANSASSLGGAQVKIRMSNFELDTARNGYVWDQFNQNTEFEREDQDNNFTQDHTLWYSRAVLGRVADKDPGAEVLTLSNGLYSFKQVVEVQGNLSKEDFLEDKYRLFIEFPDVNKATAEDCIFIKKLSVYKQYPKSTGGYYTPEDAMDENNISYNEEQRYFLINEENETKTEDQITFLPINSHSSIKPKLSSYGAKRSSINIKESNYFNAIQTLAETFECWPQLVISHYADGGVRAKQICFKNYIGQPNYSGFKYGVNSKGIKRTLDSKQIVSKLIVKANSNEFGKNGFCSISRAAANEIKDNVLYSFDHYINTGLLTDVEGLQNNLYQASASDITNLKNILLTRTYKLPDGTANSLTLQGYYPKLREINVKLEDLTELITAKSIPLSQATADYNVNKTGYDAAIEEFVKVSDKFYKVAGFSYDAIQDYDATSSEEKDKEKKDRLEQVQNSTTLLGYLTQLSALIEQKKTYYAKYIKAKEEKDTLQSAYDVLKIQYENAIKLKNVLNKKFYATYYRFIQEGTWIDESYMDDGLYYNDAKCVLYNSAKPKASYTLNVVSLAGIPGYESIDFKIGDQTFIEDTEYFGYDLEGNPFREQVTITETIEHLGDPSKNTIKVQNYENQFQDLFKKITATTQSVQYSEGSYKKASALAEADTAHKISYLTDALTDASTVLTNAGNQTWSLDENGLTIEDPARGEGLRAIGGMILLKQKDDQGNDKWVTGMTSKGISADLITAGQINTGEIQIMNGSQPTFRWDSHGITAYDFDNSTNDVYLSGWNPTKGIRFDRFGIYGYEGIDGETWHPTTISGDSTVGTIEDYSTFYLTWEGLKVTHKDEQQNISTVLRLGDNAKIDQKDTAIFKVTKFTPDGDEDVFLIDNKGNVSLKGNITFGSTIGGKDIETLFQTAPSSVDLFISNMVDILSNSDRKAKIWYYSTDPSAPWQESEYNSHVGDLWRCSQEINTGYRRPSQSTWIWEIISSSDGKNTYGWKSINAPSELFNNRENNTTNTLYINLNDAVNIADQDILIPEQDFDYNPISFKAGNIYKYYVDEEVKEWKALDYSTGNIIDWGETTTTSIDTISQLINPLYSTSQIVSENIFNQTTIGDTIRVDKILTKFQNKNIVVRIRIYITCIGKEIGSNGQYKVGIMGTGQWKVHYKLGEVYTPADYDEVEAYLQRASLMSQIVTTEEDGIYNDGNGKIGIRATAINTGVLRVGENPPDGKDPLVNALLYADISNNKVHLAGWNISTDGLVKYSTGETSFGNALRDDEALICSASESPRLSFAHSGMRRDWCLGIGPNFGVTKDGTLYARDAEIDGKIIATEGRIGSKDKFQIIIDDYGLHFADSGDILLDRGYAVIKSAGDTLTTSNTIIFPHRDSTFYMNRRIIFSTPDALTNYAIQGGTIVITCVYNDKTVVYTLNQEHPNYGIVFTDVKSDFMLWFTAKGGPASDLTLEVTDTANRINRLTQQGYDGCITMSLVSSERAAQLYPVYTDENGYLYYTKKT